jgi:hypothetical protein
MKPYGDPLEYLDLCKFHVLAEAISDHKMKKIVLAAKTSKAKTPLPDGSFCYPDIASIGLIYEGVPRMDVAPELIIKLCVENDVNLSKVNFEDFPKESRCDLALWLMISRLLPKRCRALKETLKAEEEDMEKLSKLIKAKDQEIQQMWCGRRDLLRACQHEKGKADTYKAMADSARQETEEIKAFLQRNYDVVWRKGM